MPSSRKVSYNIERSGEQSCHELIFAVNIGITKHVVVAVPIPQCPQQLNGLTAIYNEDTLTNFS